jgi:NADH:ubiquinone oxidoreductase subunit E
MSDGGNGKGGGAAGTGGRALAANIAGDAQRFGAVLVVGAGIAGIQASLDLANSGYKVYLVEQSPSIGGTMTQLDKTFPTNDCSMCIVSPKLVECSRHPNIELLTYADVEKVEGEAGRFHISVKSKARSVDSAKCTGCGACQTACPVRNTVRVPEPVDDEATERIGKLDLIIDSYGAARESMITVLQDANKAFNYLPEPVLHRISTRLGVPFAEVYGAASFYKAFSLEPRGRHLVQVCLGTACHVRGAQRILEALERRLDIPAGRTTKDGLFTIETVNCLGACALGPIVAVDGEFHGSMTAVKVPRLLDAYAGAAAPAHGGARAIAAQSAAETAGMAEAAQGKGSS